MTSWDDAREEDMNREIQMPLLSFTQRFIQITGTGTNKVGSVTQVSPFLYITVHQQIIHDNTHNGLFSP